MLVFVILVIAIGVPLYLSFGVALSWLLVGKFLDVSYALNYVIHPKTLFFHGKHYYSWWWENLESFKGAASHYNMKLAGPPLGALFFSSVTLFLLRAPLLDFRPFKKKETVHGDAHWADEKDMRAAGLFKKKGFLLGTHKKGQYLIADGFQHILLFAPTGSGKGVGFVIPNLLFWEESVVCHDIKLENHELTSGYREKVMGQKCYVWNPADPDGNTHCYNPIDWVSTKQGQMVDDVQKIANLILPEQEFWQNEARSLFVGVLLYLLAVPEKTRSFGEVVRTMRSDDVVYNLAVVLDTVGKKIHPVSYMNIAAFLQKADKERSGVISTLNSGLELWANPLIDTATASSDFNIQAMKREKITVYCGVTPDNLQRLKPLLQVFYQQATDFFTRKMPGPDEPYGVLMVMDEFPTLGKMPQFEAGIAYFRGYRVRLFLIVQDTQQLKGIYEEAGMNSFLSNSTYRITFAANNVETANLISQLIGNKTMRQESHNKPRFFDLNPASRTMHVSETARALLLPQEVIGLPRDEQIILIESQPPIRTGKIFYFKDPFFTKRLLPAVPVPTQEPYDPNKKGKKPKDDAGDAPPADTKPPKNDVPPAPKKEAPKPAAAPSPPAPESKPAAPALPPPPAPKPATPPPPAAEEPKPQPKTEAPTPKVEETKAPAAPNPFELPPVPPKPAASEPPQPAEPAPAATEAPKPAAPLPPPPPPKPPVAPVVADIPPPAAPAAEANPFTPPPLPPAPVPPQPEPAAATPGPEVSQVAEPSGEADADTEEPSTAENANTDENEDGAEGGEASDAAPVERPRPAPVPPEQRRRVPPPPPPSGANRPKAEEDAPKPAPTAPGERRRVPPPPPPSAANRPKSDGEDEA